MGVSVKAIPVLEIMSKEPVTLTADASIHDAAQSMRTRDVGSLLVVRDGKPIGIVTEKDLVTKVVAEDRLPSEMRVAECMTSPLVTVEPYQEVVEAAKTMAELRIRRLPVVDDGTLVGLVTENDVLKVWPALIEITRQRAELAKQGEGNGVGYCESCATFSDQLSLHHGQLLCPACGET
ncbi:MAG: CBS domain-containing protein [Thermoplasmata archaeon]|nr:CBS domain-containing protein [Thermoplasmata archaeon]